MTLLLPQARPHGGSARTASVLGIGRAVPPSIAQLALDPLAQTISCDTDQHRALHRRIFSRSGVTQRGSVIITGSGDAGTELTTFYSPRGSALDRGPTTAMRMERYAIEAPRLALRACREALERAEMGAGEITHLITVSCTGFFAPGLDRALIQGLAMSLEVQRTHIGFMGCHAAFNALAAANQIVRGEPEARVLVCCVELCTLHFAYGWDPGRVVANALFADGSAAAVIGHREGEAAGTEGALLQWNLVANASLHLPGSEEAMTWRIGDHGFEMGLAPSLPQLISDNVRPWVDRFLASRGLSLGDIRYFPVHPGGPKVLDAAAAALELRPHVLDMSRGVLADHGNMSSATVLFILERLLSGPQAEPGFALALGFGPGLMMEAMLLEAL